MQASPMEGEAVCLAPAVEITRALRGGHLKSATLMRHYLDRIDRSAAMLNAIVVLDREGAMAAAEAADRALADGKLLGPLHGMPMTVKDSFDVAGWPSTWGLAERRNHRATADSAAVERLRAAGAIIFGKTNVPVQLIDWETVNPVYGGTRNPWATDRSPGGSSGGAAAAVAAGLSTAEIGSDTGGSIRMPAHYCGVFGHRPTVGIVPMRGHTLNHSARFGDPTVAGPIARTAADIGLMMDVLAGPDGEDADGWILSLPPEPRTDASAFRVAILAEHPLCRMQTAYVDKLKEVAELLAGHGATVSMTALPDTDLNALEDMMAVLARAATSLHLDEATFRAAVDRAERSGPEDTSHAARNARSNAIRYRDWLAVQEQILHQRAAWRTYFRDWDVLLTPVAASSAPPFDDSGNVADRTIPVDGRPLPILDQHFWAAIASVPSLPATVAPIGVDPEGLPLGVQIIGPAYADRRTIRFAEILSKLVGRLPLPADPIPPPAQ